MTGAYCSNLSLWKPFIKTIRMFNFRQQISNHEKNPVAGLFTAYDMGFYWR